MPNLETCGAKTPCKHHGDATEVTPAIVPASIPKYGGHLVITGERQPETLKSVSNGFRVFDDRQGLGASID